MYKKMPKNTNRYEQMQNDTTIYQKYDLYDPNNAQKIAKKKLKCTINIPNDTKNNKNIQSTQETN